MCVVGLRLTQLGLENADKWGSVIGAIVGIIGLAPAYYGVAVALRDAKAADKNRWGLRSQFARHLVAELDALANKEEWEDERYTELEAEVEMEGRRRRLLGSREQRLRRVRSLSVALASSSERLILLEGEPGAGKSMALRHTAHAMATLAKERPADRVIPLYVNLKAFRPAGEITSGELRSFIVRALNPQQNSSVDKFLESEFDNGVRDGSWLFLFDSFDEIPAVLSATEADSTVHKYASAVQDFLDTMANCRGVLASREYRGPRRLGWPRFKIVRLSENRIRTLVGRWALPAETEGALLAGLKRAHEAVRDLSATPLFLSLLCQYMRSGNEFPDNPHTVFERYIGNRLTTDEARTAGLFQVHATELRAAAEQIAFAMSEDPRIGLETTRGAAVRLLVAGSFPQAAAERLVSAIVYTKLATATGPDPGDKFTFAHRRIQEFFATCVVLHRPDAVPARRLLGDHTWREAVVTILQTQSQQAVRPVLGEAVRKIRADAAAARRHQDGAEFCWPPGLLHLLDLLSVGLGGRPQWLGSAVRQEISALLWQVWKRGRRHDRLWLLEVCGVATDKDRTTFIWKGYESPGTLLREEAYRQTGRLGTVPPDLLLYARQGIVTQWAEGELRRHLPSVRAQIQRIENPGPLVAALGLVVALPVVDLLASIAVGVVVVRPDVHANDLRMAALAWPLIILAGYVTVARLSLEMIVASPSVSWATTSPATKVLQRVRDFVNGLFGKSEPPRGFWGLGVAVRIGLVAGAVTLIVTGYQTRWVAVVLSVAALYALAWAPFAIDLIVSTGSLRPARWPLLPVVWIGRGVRRAVGGYQRWRSRLRRAKILKFLRELAVGIAFAALAGAGALGVVAAMAGLVWLAGFLGGVSADDPPEARTAPLPAAPTATDSGAASTPASPGTSTGAVSPRADGPVARSDIPGIQDETDWAAGLAWTAGGIAVLVVVTLLLRGWLEARRYRRLVRQVDTIRSHRTDAGLIALFTRLRNDRQLRAFVVELRRQGELKRSPTAVGFLSDLAACAEQSRASGWRLVIPQSTTTEFRDWIAILKSRGRGPAVPRLIRSLSDATIDEITRTVAETGRPST